MRPAVSLGIAKDMGVVPGSQIMARLSLEFTKTAAQQTELTNLLAGQQNRRSAQYRKFLTPEEYASRFGLNSADIAKVVQWLETSGFSNVQVARSQASISFDGNAAQVQAVFQTSIHAYTLNSQTYFANASNPRLPKALEGLVENVDGLHNMGPKPRFTAGTGANYLVPDDWETIYDVKPLYGMGLDGSPIHGETYSIVVVGQSNVQLSDLHAFRGAAGLPVKDPFIIIPPGDSDPGLGSATGDQAESDFDLEWAGAIAKNANVAFVIADPIKNNGVHDAIKYAINNNLAPVLITSYGQCEIDVAPAEFNAENNLFEQAGVNGMTIIVTSGDSGAAACDTGAVAMNGLQVDFPASSPYVTAVGGTQFNPGSGTYFASTNNSNGGSANSYIPEVAWNDGNQAATGGGASRLISKPSWQTGIGVPSDGVRDVPDLAFAASIKEFGLLACTTGSCANGFLNGSSAPSVAGGSSAGPPTFGGVVALLVQQTGKRVGFLNPNLYSLASISGNVFHDITGGNNQVTCQGGSPGCPSPASTGTGVMGFTAGVGYDQTTGLGSLDSYNFVEQWSGDIQLTASPAALNIPAGSSATATITVTPYLNFSGPVTFTCSVASALTNVTCSVPTTPVNTSGSTTVVISAANPLASAPLGRSYPSLPRISPQWMMAVLTLSLAIYAFRRLRFVSIQTLSMWSAAALLVLTLGAVSCGSGSSNGGILSLTCNLPRALVAVPYTGGNCVASGGKAPYTYTLVTGSTGTGPLPAGLSLNSSTGSITGLPTMQSVNTFTLTATDSASPQATQTQNEVLTVGPAPALNGVVTITAKSGSIVNTTTIAVTTAL